MPRLAFTDAPPEAPPLRVVELPPEPPPPPMLWARIAVEKLPEVVILAPVELMLTAPEGPPPAPAPPMVTPAFTEALPEADKLTLVALPPLPPPPPTLWAKIP